MQARGGICEPFTFIKRLESSDARNRRAEETPLSHSNPSPNPNLTQILTVTLTLTPTLLAPAPHPHPHPNQERLLTFSTSYWLSDLLYLLAAERDPLFLAHHAVCLTIWPGSLG